MRFKNQSELFRRIRAKKKMTQTEFAALLYGGKTTTGQKIFVSRLETGKAAVPIHLWKSLIKAKQVSSKSAIDAILKDHKEDLLTHFSL